MIMYINYVLLFRCEDIYFLNGDSKVFFYTRLHRAEVSVELFMVRPHALVQVQVNFITVQIIMKPL